MMFRGVYQVEVNVKLQKYKQAKPVAVKFKVTILCNTAPKVSGFFDFIKLKNGQATSVVLGIASDDDP